MKVKLFGAARSVTGSCYRVETDKVAFSIDYGMHQGNAPLENRNRATASYNPESLNFIILTHAHIDHSGLLPKAVKDGFKGAIYCTEATKDLVHVMLLDSAFIQEKDAEWETRKRARQNKPPVFPLYDSENVDGVIQRIVTVPYDKPTTPPDSNITFTFRDAGHILGSAFVELEAHEAEGTTTVIFSGDLGRKGALMMHDISKPHSVPDYLFLESTYGDRNHKPADSSEAELAEAINYSYQQGEKTIIPAFAVERTQELLLIIKKLLLAKKIPQDIPVFVDSPLAIRATKIFSEHLPLLDEETIALTRNGNNPFEFKNLKYTFDAKESQELNNLRGPGIIISASGMCNAGRIRHHLVHNIWRKGASIVFVGYQSVGTPGRHIVDGAKTITLLGEELSIAAKVFTIGGFSSHAGQDQLVDWVKSFANDTTQILLTHGEDKAITALSKRLQDELDLLTYAPEYLEEFTLSRSVPMHTEIEEREAIDWNKVFTQTTTELKELEKHLAKLPQKHESVQYDVYNELVDLRKRIVKILDTV